MAWPALVQQLPSLWTWAGGHPVTWPRIQQTFPLIPNQTTLAAKLGRFGTFSVLSRSLHRPTERMLFLDRFIAYKTRFIPEILSRETVSPRESCQCIVKSIAMGGLLLEEDLYVIHPNFVREFLYDYFIICYIIFTMFIGWMDWFRYYSMRSSTFVALYILSTRRLSFGRDCVKRDSSLNFYHFIGVIKSWIIHTWIWCCVMFSNN